MNHMEKSRRVALCGLLTAIMLLLGFVESRLPAGPVPGIKLGLSNSALVFSIYMLGIPDSWLLMTVKIILSGLLFGGVSAMLYALAGGILSMAVMSLLSRGRGISAVPVSMAGGVAHNMGQTILAMCVLRTPKLLYYMAILMCAGAACGALTGLCAASVLRIFLKRKK